MSDKTQIATREITSPLTGEVWLVAFMLVAGDPPKAEVVTTALKRNVT